MPEFLTAPPSDQLLETYKMPPHSVEAEQSVLGGLMLDNHAWDKVADVLTEDDFYRQDHRLIYRHICKLVEHSKPADVVTVAESLEMSAELQNVGGLAYIGVIAQNTPSAANIRRYAEIVRERSSHAQARAGWLGDFRLRLQPSGTFRSEICWMKPKRRYLR